MIVFAVILAVFTALTFQATNTGLDNVSGHDPRVLRTTLCTITGPLTGAISRGLQGCCLEFSLIVMAFYGPVLLIGVVAQFIRMPDRKWLRVMRMTLWILGWLVWFMGGMFSFVHALN